MLENGVPSSMEWQCKEKAFNVVDMRIWKIVVYLMYRYLNELWIWREGRFHRLKVNEGSELGKETSEPEVRITSLDPRNQSYI